MGSPHRLQKTYQEARTRFTKEMGETLTRQVEEWMEVQRRAGEALKEMELTNQALAGLEQEVRRTNKELAILPEGLHKAGEVIERLTEIANASSELSDLKAQAKLVMDELKGVAGASKRQEEALDVTVKKLQTLAEVTGRELESHGKLQGAIEEISAVAAAAGRYGESLKDTEREVQRINMGLKGVRSAMQDEGLKLAEVLKQTIIAFDEAKMEKARLQTRRGRRRRSGRTRASSMCAFGTRRTWERRNVGSRRLRCSNNTSVHTSGAEHHGKIGTRNR